MSLGIGRIDHDFGVVAQCPHCGRTNVPKTTKVQFTCGSRKCRCAQDNLKRRQARARKARKAMAA